MPTVLALKKSDTPFSNLIVWSISGPSKWGELTKQLTESVDLIAFLSKAPWGVPSRQVESWLFNPGIRIYGLYGDEGILEGGGSPLCGILPNPSQFSAVETWPWVRFKDDKLCLIRYRMIDPEKLGEAGFRHFIFRIGERLESFFGDPENYDVNLPGYPTELQRIWRDKKIYLGLDAEWRQRPHVTITAIPPSGNVSELLSGKTFMFTAHP